LAVLLEDVGEFEEFVGALWDGETAVVKEGFVALGDFFLELE